MNIEKYQLKADSEFLRFEFVSEGKKGIIRKLIEFQKTNKEDVFNLAFGDYDLETEEINDLLVSNNGDTDRVLATVVAAVYTFFSQNHSAFVYATGSTKARTRLYRIGISRFYEQV